MHWHGQLLMLLGATLIWSLVMRLQFLAHIEERVVASQLQPRGNDGWLDELPTQILRAHWSIVSVLYATAALWALVPVYLHLRIGRLTAPSVSDASPNTAAAGEPGIKGPPAEEQDPACRATQWAGFLLGCAALHFLLLHITVLGLWPWLLENASGFRTYEAVEEQGWLLSLLIFFLALCICAIAASVYTRTAPMKAQRRSSALVAVLIGSVAYLLTNFVVLAIAWFAVWLAPTLWVEFLELVYTGVELGFIAAFFFIPAVLLLWLFSNRLSVAPGRWSAVLACLLVLAGVPTFIAWELASSNNGKSGAAPGTAITGVLEDARWRTMEQWCTGVVQTRDDTWLIGRNRDTVQTADYLPPDTPDLSTLITNSASNSGSDPYLRNWGSDPYLTTLARLEEDGSFKVVAVVPDVACMVVSPESEALYLFTGVRMPKASSAIASSQTAVYRSTDRGESWEWLESGFMLGAERLAWNLRPIFFSDDQVWAWSKGSHPPSLFYSPDRGASVIEVESTEPLVAPLSLWRELAGDQTLNPSSHSTDDRERFVVQVDEQQAWAWVSEFMWHRQNSTSRPIRVTTRLRLERPANSKAWVVADREHRIGERLLYLQTSSDGQSYGIIHDDEGEWMVKLDPQTGEWMQRHATPSLFPSWLADDRTGTRYFWSNGRYQVISKWGDTGLPRILFPFTEEPLEVDTDAHFYSRDGGQTWQQLAIPGYLGVMGLSRQGNKLYWSQGNWYSNNEPNLREYTLP